MYLLLAATGLMLPVASAVGFVTSAWPAAVGVLLLGSLALFSAGIGVVGAMKRNRPSGYFMARARIATKPWLPLPFIHTTQRWQGEHR